MQDLIKLLKEIDNDFYKGVYTVGEHYDLVKSIKEILKTKNFI